MPRHQFVLLVVVILLAGMFLTRGSTRAAGVPRILPLPSAQWTDADRTALGRFAQGDRTINVFATCVRHRDLCAAWIPFTSYVLSPQNTLARRDRELVILATSWACRAEYDWAHHVPAGRNAGLTDQEIARIQKGADAPGWRPLDTALLHAVDELHRDQRIADGTWRTLTAHYNEKQMMDIVFTVGQYTIVSMFLKSADVQLEPGVKGF